MWLLRIDTQSNSLCFYVESYYSCGKYKVATVLPASQFYLHIILQTMSSITFVKRNGFASIIFDYIRFLAALAVVIGHGVARFFGPYSEVNNPTIFEKIFRVLLSGYGSPAVMVFFVLSGMFIGQSVIRQIDNGNFKAGNYFARRLIRLWLVLLPALVLTYFIDTLGVTYLYSDGIYQENKVFGSINFESLGVDVFFSNLFFLQTIIAPNLGTNGALWSLANEFWYYVAFPLLYFAVFGKAPLLNKLVLFALTSLLLYFIGADIAALFLVWLMGVVLLYMPTASIFARNYKKILTFSTLLFIGTLLFVRLSSEFDSKYIERLVCGVSFAIFCFSLMKTEDKFSVTPKHQKVSYELAGFSYTLYLIHTPILCLCRALLIDSEGYWSLNPVNALVFMGVVALILALAYGLAKITEFQTHKIYKRFKL